MPDSDKFLDSNGTIHIPESEVDVGWRPSVYGFLVVDGKILMVKDGRGNSAWELPGGGLEKNESLAEGLAREFLEETGYHVRVTADAPIFAGCRNYFDTRLNKYFRSLPIVYKVEFLDQDRDLSQHNLQYSDEIGGTEWLVIARLKKEDIHHMWHPFLTKVFTEVNFK